MFRFSRLALSTILLVGTTVLAQERTAEDETETHDALRALRDAVGAAMNAKDVAAMAPYLDEDVVFTTMNGDVRVGVDAIKQYHVDMMEGPDRVVDDIQIEFTADALTRLYGDDVGVCYGRSEGTYELTNGMTLAVDARWTCTLVNEAGDWKIAAFHYSTNMFDNPVLDAVKSTVVRTGIIGGLIVLALGLFLGRLSVRRRA